MSGDLSRTAIEALDPQGMLGDVLGQPHQLTDGLWRVRVGRPRTDQGPGRA